MEPAPFRLFLGKYQFENEHHLMECAVPFAETENEMYKVMELIKSPARIKINYRRWKEKDGNKFPPWESVAKCPLWSLEEYKAFRLMMERHVRELSPEPPTSEKVKTIRLGTANDDKGANTDRVDSEGAALDSGEVVATRPRT